MKDRTSLAQCTNSRPPATDEYFEYYGGYVQLVKEGDISRLAENQVEEMRTVFQQVPESHACVLHSPYTWTLKQVCGHMIDTERIFSDRLHRFAAADFQPLPGMDQDIYVAQQDFETPSLKSLVDEMLFCRQANVLLLRRLKREAWDHRGVASDRSVTVRALAYMLVGHVSHHLNIIQKRLLQIQAT
ncbi:MAG: DinB family protein [Pirellula sp.]